MNQDRRALLLLLSLVLFFILVPLLERDWLGGIFLVVSLYFTLAAATLQLSEDRKLFWCAIPIGACSMVLVLASHLMPARSLYMANSLVLAIFLGIVGVSLFRHLDERGQITSGRIYSSVSLYFLIGLSWYALFTFVNAVQPGSFAENGVVLSGKPTASTLLYFSLTSLTTLGYGDILAVKPLARILATLEAAAGILFIAITVARLVAAYQATGQNLSSEQSSDHRSSRPLVPSDNSRRIS